MKLIDADKLKTELDAWARIIRKPNCYSREDALHIIDTAPEVKAVPVVRCKECGHYDTTGYPALNPGTGWCDKMGKGIHDDFYCFYGERKESEGST